MMERSVQFEAEDLRFRLLEAVNVARSLAGNGGPYRGKRQARVQKEAHATATQTVAPPRKRSGVRTSTARSRADKPQTPTQEINAPSSSRTKGEPAEARRVSHEPALSKRSKAKSAPIQSATVRPMNAVDPATRLKRVISREYSSRMSSPKLSMKYLNYFSELKTAEEQQYFLEALDRKELVELMLAMEMTRRWEVASRALARLSRERSM